MFISILTPVVKKRQSTVSYSFASCSSKNTVTRSTYYRVAGTSTWINASASFNSGTAFTFGDGKISAETSYEVKYELTDAFTTISITDIVSTASVVMDFKSGGKGVAIGKVSETNAFQVLYHLNSTPAVECNLTDIETLTEFFNELLNISIMNYIALRSLQIPLPFPNIVGNMIPSDSQFQGFFRYPEVWKDAELVLFIQWWEYQNECRDICCTGKIKSAVAYTAFQVIFTHCKRAFIPFLHRHPANCLFHPLINT